ncbi:CMT1A duplicated region transcript 4 protein [Trichechus inunguis]|uniref:CMT1A duplicated region transcript 4 protein n=1 Tax=Trichechus manatus latirostris TaxID=127582 RepID=A0A2Y9QZS8_TRIMA|nr:CMT1A duplicated region transcript 4 protein [Trichechus manatus latirostris]
MSALSFLCFSLLVELTENIGLPLNLLEKHDPWPAYVTYTSPVVKRLVEKNRARELECVQTSEETRRGSRHGKPPNIIQLKWWKPSKSSSEVVLKDTLSETMLSVWGTYSVMAMAPTVLPEPTHFITDSRECPTTNYNKIIFSRKPMMRMLPYSSLLTSKEKHSNG